MQRIALTALAALVIVGAYLVFRPRDDSSTDTPTQTSTAPRTADRAQRGGGETPRAGAGRGVPRVERVTVVAGQPAGGARTLTFSSGERARIVVSSTDSSGEVHLHGYDIERELAPGRPVTFPFRANLQGIYTLELHPETELARVEVRP